jgi:hypothetical protein
MAEQAFAKITAAFETFRDARDVPNAAVYEAELPAGVRKTGSLDGAKEVRNLH